jgi:cytochrome b561
MIAATSASPAAAERYDTMTVALHWATVMLVGLLWTIGQTIDFAPSGPLRIDYRSLHMVLGITLACVFITRVWWRSRGGLALPGVDNMLMRVVAWLMHRLLYLIILTTVVLGITNVWVRGDSVFNLFKVPAFDPGDRALRDSIGDWHALAANTLVIVAGLHAAVALFHHFILRDGVLRRMLPVLK